MSFVYECPNFSSLFLTATSEFEVDLTFIFVVDGVANNNISLEEHINQTVRCGDVLLFSSHFRTFHGGGALLSEIIVKSDSYVRRLLDKKKVGRERERERERVVDRLYTEKRQSLSTSHTLSQLLNRT